MEKIKSKDELMNKMLLISSVLSAQLLTYFLLKRQREKEERGKARVSGK